MLPSLLDSTYKRYKADTSIFLGWLSESAQKCGYTSHATKSSATAAPAAAKSTRPKGKARKEAKKAEGSNSASTLTDKGQEEVPYLVSLKELMPLATAIVKLKKPLLMVPSDVIRAGFRAISARKRCMAHFEEQSGDTESNDRHWYFASLMEDVILELRPRFQTDNSTAESSTEAAIEYLENRFAALEVENPSEENTKPLKSGPKTSQPVYELEPPTDSKVAEEEKLFEVLCMLQDLRQLRDFVYNLWLDYKIGKVDLITASVTINAAFHLAVKAQEEVNVAYPEVFCTWDVEQTLKLNNERILAFREWTFRPAYNILSHIILVNLPGTENVCILPQRGHLRRHQGRASVFPGLDLEQNEDFILFYELLPDFYLHWRSKVPIYAMDEFTRGLFKMFETRKIPLWLSMLTSCFLDIHHILGDSIGNSLRQFLTLHGKATKIVNRFMDLTSKILEQPSNWAGHSEKMAQYYVELFSSISDQTFEYKQMFYLERQYTFPGESERYYLHKRHPILCGTFAARLTLDLNSFGRLVVNRWGTALYPSHLYNALRHQKDPISLWPLMEQVIEIHSEERVFVGARPQDLYNCYKQMWFVLGYTAEQFAPHRRRMNLTWSQASMRSLDDPSPIGKILHQNFVDKKGMAYMIHDIEKILIERVRNADTKSNLSSKPQTRKWHVTKRLTSHELLQALRECMTAELPKLQFDYFKVHEQALKLLQILVSELHGDFLKEFEESY